MDHLDEVVLGLAADPGPLGSSPLVLGLDLEAVCPTFLALEPSVCMRVGGFVLTFTWFALRTGAILHDWVVVLGLKFGRIQLNTWSGCVVTVYKCFEVTRFLRKPVCEIGVAIFLFEKLRLMI